MPRLLVSVRSAQEAAIALDAGVDLIDIKEPAAGALGAATAQTVAEILQLVDQRAATSVACGELRESASDALEAFSALGGNGHTGPSGPDYIKIGMSGCAATGGWAEKWRAVVALAPARSIPVAVIYADWETAGAPPPHQIIAEAQALPRAAVLLDTFDKSGPGLMRLLSLNTVQALIRDVQSRQMQVAVAGQLTLDDARALAALGPDYIGVRGAVCRSNRNGTLDGRQVTHWQRLMHHFAPSPGFKACYNQSRVENA